MRGDADFATYASARWPFLVRALVLSGCPRSQAPLIAADALSRCRRGWARESREGDVQALVLEELVEAWARERGTLEVDPTAPPLDEVLSRYDSAVGERLREEAERIDVPPAPALDEIRSLERARRRRSTRRVLAVLVPLALVLGGVTWSTTRLNDAEDPAALDPVRATSATNPVSVAWYADGVLHLDAVTLAVPDLVELRVLGAATIYADDEGHVVRLERDGTRRRLGAKDPGSSLVADAKAADGHGLVVWTTSDPAGERLNVYDVEQDEIVAMRAVRTVDARGRDARFALVSIVEEVVFYEDRSGTHGWLYTEPEPATEVAEIASLVAAAGQIRAYDLGGTQIRISRLDSGVDITVPGTSASLSSGGDYLLTQRVQDAEAGLRPVVVFDTLLGSQVATGIDERFEYAVTARLGEDDEVAYVVARRSPDTSPGFVRNEPSGAQKLRTCHLATSSCQDFSLPTDTGAVVLAD